MYRKLLLWGTVLSATLFFLSCSIFSPPDHQVRVQNNNTYAIIIIIGEVDYGTIPAGGQTSYKSIDEGKHTISGGSYNGYVEINGGHGRQEWTLTFDGDSISIEEDE